MNAKTARIIDYIRQNPSESRKVLSEKFECTPNNITNIRRRYRIYINDPSMHLDISKGKKKDLQHRDNQNKGLKCTPVLRYVHYILTGKSVSLTKQQYKTAIMVLIAEL